MKKGGSRHATWKKPFAPKRPLWHGGFLALSLRSDTVFIGVVSVPFLALFFMFWFALATGLLMTADRLYASKSTSPQVTLSAEEDSGDALVAGMGYAARIMHVPSDYIDTSSGN